MSIVLLGAGMALTWLAAKHHLRAQQARDDYEGAKENLPELQQKARRASRRALVSVGGLVVAVVVMAAVVL